MELPLGFVAHVGNIGIKDNTTDVLLLAATRQPAIATGVFTKSLFSGPSVEISRRNLAGGTAQAVAIVSKNANVATGKQGTANAEELARLTAEVCGCDPGKVIVGSTGVIGVPYPMEKLRSYFKSLGKLDSLAKTTTSAVAAAQAMMTTDTHPKTSQASARDARVVGIAKGVGMIEPDMATMLAVITTDADLAGFNELDKMFKRVVDRTFNALSVDTDTSTSDMAVLLASGASGPVSDEQLETALTEVCTDLTRQLAADGEGAETLIVVTVDQAKDEAQAKRVAKAVVNSPLVKTAVHGNDPNWGRVAMAVGKCQDDRDINQDEVIICFGTQEVYPSPASPAALNQLTDYLNQEEVLIHISLNTGTCAFTVYGCDLTDGYIRINADYTT